MTRTIGELQLPTYAAILDSMLESLREHVTTTKVWWAQATTGDPWAGFLTDPDTDDVITPDDFEPVALPPAPTPPLGVPVRRPAHVFARWRCATYGCPDRPPQEAPIAPTCYTCGRPMSRVG